MTNGMSEAKYRLSRCLCVYVCLFYLFETLIMNDSIKRLNIFIDETQICCPLTCTSCSWVSNSLQQPSQWQLVSYTTSGSCLPSSLSPSSFTRVIPSVCSCTNTCSKLVRAFGSIMKTHLKTHTNITLMCITAA